MANNQQSKSPARGNQRAELPHIIRHNRTGGSYIAGFSVEHQIIQCCSSHKLAKRFPNLAAANKWIKQYADCGYGLASTDAVPLALE